ncbi:ALH_1b_G0012730.mRNA.1.CDS.1 [Saccharomyces cerevisiae]|nr:ALH_1c_G0012700.mRNA.1.CDS.1 [Saccharomyces cerevisiae]CAI4381215.1 ALH_1b_G0012730.mRNA.1.CDS.1 [Saccharomyces cerevisiae]CAI5002762.1 CGH_1_HP_G0076830.mRNA.1.CDS.1 [Saccharomyces cerevisiae]CAI5049103.1 CGH_1_HP_G0110830.mRNA.1.CDS.1 [Saccharomyces cerevisiae]CAI5252982.1 AKR_HP2_G0012800.mRNA.1.CDS.1 [Saccharomyces cerevisiae]
MINLEDYWEDETPGPDREPTNELRNEVEETITLMELLKVSELKDICRSVSFPVSGRKAVLQDLIRNFLQNALVVGKSDPYRVQAVKFLIERIRKNEPLPVYKDLWNALRKGTPLSAITVRSMEGPPTVQQQSPSVIRQSPTQRRKTSTTSSTSRAPPPTKPDASSSSSSFAVPTIHFKESPFYKIQRLIPELVMNVEVTGGRGMCSAKFKLSKADYNLLSNPNSKHRLYLFSGMINPLGSRGNEPIQFPFPNELRCNNVQIKDNIRGFKSKPGTAKPADLTPHLKPYTQQNNVELIYAFTTKEYKLFGYIVEMITPEQLLEKVLQHPKIIKQATLLYLKKTLREDEEMGLTTTSTIMSLQCPISYTRMKYPSKSINCKHLQCFDALWFLHSQLQIPTWQCPVCQIDIALENLAISEFVDDILQNCQKNVEQVELTSDGKWTAILEEDDDSDSDSNDGSRSPEKETTTPVTNRVIPEYLGNSSSYIGKQLPNILGKTPLNVTAVDNSSHLISPDVSVSSPTPRNTASNASSSALSTPPLIRMSSLDPRGSTVPDKTIRPPINSNSYTASISDSFVQPQESSVFPPREQNTDMSFPSTVNSRFNDPRLNTTRFPDSTLRGATILSNNGLDQRNNSLPTTEAITRNDVGRQNSTPVLPTLPQNLPIRTNSNKSGLPLINNENSVPNPPNTATIPLQKSRLIVNPFIPRRPYSNVLPQKRQLSNTSSTSPIMGTWKTQDYGKKYNSG